MSHPARAEGLGKYDILHVIEGLGKYIHVLGCRSNMLVFLFLILNMEGSLCKILFQIWKGQKKIMKIIMQHILVKAKKQ